MPVGESGERGVGARRRVHLVVAVVLGAIGVTFSIPARQRNPLGWLALVAWASAIAAFGWPWIRPRVRPVAVAASAGAVLVSVGAALTWVLAPAALVAWAVVAQVVRAAWRGILAAGAAVLALAAGALVVGAEGASDALAEAAFALGCLACATAAVGRLRGTSPMARATRRVR